MIKAKSSTISTFSNLLVIGVVLLGLVNTVGFAKSSVPVVVRDHVEVVQTETNAVSAEIEFIDSEEYFDATVFPDYFLSVHFFQLREVRSLKNGQQKQLAIFPNYYLTQLSTLPRGNEEFIA